MQTLRILFPGALLLYGILLIPAQGLLFLRGSTPPASQPSPSKWLAKAIWGDERNVTNKKIGIPESWWCPDEETEEHDEGEKATSQKETKRWCASYFHQSLFRVRTLLLLQVIRLVLLFHIEGPVLRRLPGEFLFEIIQECLKEEARPHLLRVVATELDRRRQDYEFGDISRYTVKQFAMAWKRQFGKEYQFGDITRGVLERAAQVAESEGWKKNLQEEMESVQDEFGSKNKKWWLTRVTAFPKVRRMSA